MNLSRRRVAARQACFSGLAFCTVLAVAVARVSAGTIEVEGALAWSASLDEQGRTALISETLGPGPGPVLKKFLNVNTPGVWTATVIATNGSGQTWTDFHYDLLYPPAVPSVANDGIDFNNPQVGGGLPCATIGALQVCVGTWSIMPDSLWVDFTQGNSTGTVPPGQVVSMVFDLTIASPPVQMPVSFTLAEHYTIPEPATLGLLLVGLVALLPRRRRRGRRNRRYDLRAVCASLMEDGHV